MNDHDALLNAIGEHPEEDTPRLMYADWLEEHDQPERADFVRNQVELGRLDINDPARREPVVKNVYYLKNFVPQWKAELPYLPHIEWGDFNRGLIEEAQANDELPIVDHAAEIFAVPGIHILRLRWLHAVNNPRSAPHPGRALAQVPQLTRLRVLRLIASRVSAESLRELFASPHLRKLAIIDLHGNLANDAFAWDIVDGRFPELTELWLGNNTISAGGAMALASSPHLTKLRILDLRGNHAIDREGRTALRQRFGSALKM